MKPLRPLSLAAFLFADYWETGRFAMPKHCETRHTLPAMPKERQ
jgi:hypothetical protein